MAINNSTRARQSRRPAYMFSDAHRSLFAARMVKDGYSVAHAAGATCINPGYVRAVLHADPETLRQLGTGKLRLVDLFQGYCSERRRHQASEARAQAEAQARAEAEAKARAQAEADAKKLEAEAKKVEAEVDQVLDKIGLVPVVARIIGRFGVEFLLGAADAVLQPRGQDLVDLAFNAFGPERVSRAFDKLTAPRQSSSTE